MMKPGMISWSEALQNNKEQCGIDLAGVVLMAFLTYLRETRR